jgi:hypothetical protein
MVPDQFLLLLLKFLALSLSLAGTLLLGAVVPSIES